MIAGSEIGAVSKTLLPFSSSSLEVVLYDVVELRVQRGDGGIAIEHDLAQPRMRAQKVEQPYLFAHEVERPITFADAELPCVLVEAGTTPSYDRACADRVLDTEGLDAAERARLIEWLREEEVRLRKEGSA